MPHPWNDFCEEFFYNDQDFLDYLNRNHLTCHLCGDAHKHVYYRDYESLEKHFAASHFLCPYQECKSKCYVAFATENEMKAHMNIAHTKRKTDKIDANALLGFNAVAEDEDSGFKGKKRYEQNQKV